MQHLKKISLQPETLELLNVKNTDTEKSEEASNFLKDNHLNLTIIEVGGIRHYAYA